jgi:hypothetical protein
LEFGKAVITSRNDHGCADTGRSTARCVRVRSRQGIDVGARRWLRCDPCGLALPLDRNDRSRAQKLSPRPAGSAGDTRLIQDGG